MISPIARPAHSSSSADRCAGEVAEVRRTALGGCPIASRRAIGFARHRAGLDFDMAGRERASWPAKQRHQSIPSINAADRRAGLFRLARAIDFSGGNTSNPDPWTFGAPNRSVSVPHSDRRANECESRSHNLNQRLLLSKLIREHSRRSVVATAPPFCGAQQVKPGGIG